MELEWKFQRLVLDVKTNEQLSSTNPDLSVISESTGRVIGPREVGQLLPMTLPPHPALFLFSSYSYLQSTLS